MTVSFRPENMDALVFDVGGVFVVPHHAIVGPHLRQAGFGVPDGPEHYHRAHYRGVHALAGSGRADEHDPTFWKVYHRAYVQTLGVGDDQLEEARRALGRLFGTATGLWRQRIEENIDGLARLAGGPRPLAIVSNNDGTAEAQMVDLGVCQVGDGPLPSVRIVVDSGAIGVAKPDPAIFAPALEALGTAAARTLYVGDTVHADVRGARAAGMPVAQIDPYDHHAEFDHDRIASLAALADLLDAASA